MLRGAPDAVWLGPGAFPMRFSADLEDFRHGPESVSWRWTSSDSETIVVSPNAQTTAVYAASMPDCGVFFLSVTAAVGDGELRSSVQGAMYGTNDAPVRVALSLPRTVAVNDDGDCQYGLPDWEVPGRHDGDDDIVPVAVVFQSDVPTNGVLRICPMMHYGWLWRSEDRSEAVECYDEIGLTNCTEFSRTYYMECAAESLAHGSDFVSVTWDDGTGPRTVSRQFTVVRRIAEPVTAECTSVGGEEHVVNPCCAIIGSNTYMRVSVSPPDFPDDKIAWRVADGAAVFPDGNTGREVYVVAGGEEGDALKLEVDFDGCPGRRPQFDMMVVDMHCVTVFPCVVAHEDRSLCVDVRHIEEMLREVNAIYRQVGVNFVLADVQYVRNGRWTENGLSSSRVSAEIRNFMRNTRGVEVYFVEGRPFDHAAGMANEYGVIVKASANGRTLAHEIGHVCRLADIYYKRPGAPATEESIPFELQEWPCADRLPSDWNNGTGSCFYAPALKQYDVVKRLLMFGEVSPAKADIPAGAVFGMTTNVQQNVQGGAFLLQNANVGRSGMLVFPPRTQ